LLLCGLAATVRAEEAWFESVGKVQVTGADRVKARERALEEALRLAVEAGSATVLDPAGLQAHASDLRLRVYPRARSYVATWRILDEGVDGEVFHVHLSAQVLTARLAHDLEPAQGSNASNLAATRQRAVVCFAANGAVPPSPEGAIRGIGTLLGARGVEAVAGPSFCTDEAAAQAARAQGAEGAIAGTLEASSAGTIRGTDRVAAHARAVVHLVEPGGRISAEATAEREAYESTLELAAQAAAKDAAAEAIAQLETALAAKWPANPGSASGVIVRLVGVARYLEYQQVARALAAVPGVASVEARAFGRGEIELHVRTTASASQLAGLLERRPLPEMRLEVQSADSGTLTLKVAPATVAPGPG
jgi:hypothetical protein